MIISDGTKLKLHILKEYDQISIFAAYLQINESDIEYCLDSPSNKINNPLRVDNHPSFGFFPTIDKETGLYKIRMHDYAYRQYRGDCFDMVGIIKRLNSRFGDHFMKICYDIISIMDTYKSITRNKIYNKFDIITNSIKIEVREFNSIDLQYWNKVGLTEKDLHNNKVYPVHTAYLNGEQLYTNNLSDPCYAYYLDNYGSIILYKLYYPFRKGVKHKARFITNNNIYPIECVHEMKKADILMLTKSRKDVLVMRKLMTNIKTNYSFQINNITGECVILTEEYMAKLRSIYKYIFINTDPDYTGITTGNEYKRKYGILRFIPTIGKYGTTNMGGKDISDIVKNKGEQEAIKLLRIAYNFIDCYIKSKETINSYESDNTNVETPF